MTNWIRKVFNFLFKKRKDDSWKYSSGINCIPLSDAQRKFFIERRRFYLEEQNRENSNS